MPSVRDSLKDERPARNESAQESLELGKQRLQEGQDGLDQAELIAARLRETADQRAAMAQTEINKLQNHIQQLQQRMDELAKMQMPPGKLSGDLEDAMARLDDAEANLARANEAKQNTELTSSLRNEHQEPSLHMEGARHGVGSGAPKVGAVLGIGGDAQHKIGVKAPARKL